MLNKKHSKGEADTKASLAALYACKTEEEAQKLVDTFSPHERRKVLMLADCSKISFLPPVGEINFSFSDSTGGDTSQDAVNSMYDSLFARMSSAKKQALAEGKKLHVIVGENHVDRSGLLVSALILHIAGRLGIKDLGIELFPEDSVAGWEGKTVLGFGPIKALASTSTVLSEQDDQGLPLGPMRKNCQFQMMLAHKIGMEPFSNDPKGGSIAYSALATLDNVYVYDKREGPMAQVLKVCMIKIL